MSDDELDKYLRSLAQANREMVEEAAREANEIVRSRSRRSAVRHSMPAQGRIVAFPLRFPEWAALAALVFITAVVTALAVRFLTGPQHLVTTAVVTQWEPRNATNSVSMLANMLPTGWRRAGAAFGIARFQDAALAPIQGATLEVETWSQLASDMLLIPSPHLVTRFNERATEATARSDLRWLAATFSQPTDQVFLYFATHGQTNAAGGLRIKFYDSKPNGGVDLAEIAELFKNSKAQVFVLGDACYAANLTGQDYAWADRIGMLAAASTGQVAASANISGQSVFSATLFRLLQGAGDADTNGIITVREIFQPLREETQRRSAGAQIPALILSANQDPVLSVTRSLQKGLPPPGKIGSARAEIGFTLRNAGAYRLFLDGVDLGETGPGEVDLTVVQVGEHELRIDSLPAAPTAEPRRWLGRVATRPGARTIVEPLVSPAPIAEAVALSAEGGLFPRTMKNPDTSQISVVWQDDGSVLIHFLKDQQAPEKMTVLFAADPQRGVSVPALFGLNTNDVAVLVFEARAEDGPVDVKFFTGGAGGNESLITPVEQRSQLVAASWRQIRMPLPSAETTRLVGGLGIEVSRRTDGGVVALRLKDVRLVKSR